MTEAGRPFELSEAEDQVDAVLCAYIALYFARRRDDITIYGDPSNDYADGYIATPTLPEDMKRAPRPTPATPAADFAGMTEGYGASVTAIRQRCEDVSRNVHDLLSVDKQDATEIARSLERVVGLLAMAEQEFATIGERVNRAKRKSSE